jgi:hypothetical protein
MPREFLERLRAPVLESYLRIEAAVPGVTVWDPFPTLCPPGPTCDAIRDGRPLFFDGDHLSGYANRVLAPDFGRHLEQLAASDVDATRPDIADGRAPAPRVR